MSDMVNSYEVQVKTVERVPTAIVRGHARSDNMSKMIRRLFDEFYAAPPPPPRGLNVVYYPHLAGESVSAEGIPLEVGVQLAAPFTGGEGVKASASATPAGVVATVVHWGAYDKLRDAYDALREWSKESGRVLTGPFWEVYGHWSDDPKQVRTDVFYILGK
jgi:effector-binding domain-containing protein